LLKETTHRMKKKDVFCLLAILLLSYFLFFFNLGSYSLKEPDEGRYAEIPREMVEQGDYLVPHLNYVRYFEKPPLLYWVTAASYKLFGINEWSFRLPNALVALLCAIILYLFARRWFFYETGFFGALILISCFGFFAMTHIVTTDMLFTFLLFGALLCFNEYYRGHRRFFFYLFHIALAMATLTKGPVALILVGATILIYLYTEKRLSFLRDIFNVRGVLLFMVITLPWFISISLREKEFLQFFFIDQNILRFLTTKHNRSGPPYYFISILAAGMLPWSVFLPRAIIGLWRNNELRIFFIWSAVVFLFFSISGSKLPPYILPLFPPLSLVMGYFFALRRQETVPVSWEIIFYIIFFVIIIIAGLFGVSGMIVSHMKVSPDIPGILQNIKNLEIGIIIISACMISMMCVRRMRRFSHIFYALTGFSLAILMMLMFHVKVIDEQKTTKSLAKIINSSFPRKAMVVNLGSFEETLPFYTGRRVYVADYQGELTMGSKYPDAAPYFLDKKAFITLFDSGEPILTVVSERALPDLYNMVHLKPELLGCQGETCLITNTFAFRLYTMDNYRLTN